MPTSKICSKCKCRKSLSAFFKNHSHKDGLDSQCKNCKKEYHQSVRGKAAKQRASKKYCSSEKGKTFYRRWSKKYRKQRGKLWVKETQLISRYGITLDDWNELFTSQNGCCAICSKHQSELKKGLVIDHNHETGKVRGLLCKECNLALGLMRDSAENFQNAISYLTNSDSR